MLPKYLEPGPTTQKSEALVTTRALLRIEKTDGLDAALPLLQSRVGLWARHTVTWVLTISVRRRRNRFHLLARERVGLVTAEQICARNGGRSPFGVRRARGG